MGRDKEGFILKGEQFQFNCKNVVLTTGGLSYPTTGSDGTGYRLAQSFGHSMVETVPALTPLSTKDNELKSLSGITLEVQLTLLADGKRYFPAGTVFSLPILDFQARRHWISAGISLRLRPKADHCKFYPGVLMKILGGRSLIKAQKDNPRKTLKNVLIESMPQRLADVILKKAGIESPLTMNQLDKASRQRMIDLCVHYPLDVTGVLGYSKAEVTAGGIDLGRNQP